MGMMINADPGIKKFPPSLSTKDIPAFEYSATSNKFAIRKLISEVLKRKICLTPPLADSLSLRCTLKELRIKILWSVALKDKFCLTPLLLGSLFILAERIKF